MLLKGLFALLFISFADPPCTLAAVEIRPFREKLKLIGCSQSTVTHGGVCSRALDGNVDQNWNHGSCTYTNYNEKGWWTAQLERPTYITEVVIHNRLDCCSERLNSFVIEIDGRECASHQSGSHFSVQTFKCSGIGQTVTIRSRLMHPLTLCEVQIYGTPPTAPRNDKQLKLSDCTQSSTWYDGECGRAIDGNTNQNYDQRSCTHTNNEQGWWKAQTEKRAYITEVRIYNRLCCCSERLNNFAVSVDGQECASYNSPSYFTVRIFKCGKAGRTLMIQNRQVTPLTLCEVEAFGWFV